MPPFVLTTTRAAPTLVQDSGVGRLSHESESVIGRGVPDSSFARVPFEGQPLWLSPAVSGPHFAAPRGGVFRTMGNGVAWLCEQTVRHAAPIPFAARPRRARRRLAIGTTGRIPRCVRAARGTSRFIRAMCCSGHGATGSARPDPRGTQAMWEVLVGLARKF